MPISNSGVIITPSATSIADAQQILIDTYGSGVNLARSSPNGQWVQNVALAITERENDQVDTVNSINPNIATGTQLDAICANLNIQRISATFSTATIQVTGLTGVSIPALTQVQSINGDIFLIDTTITIGGGGSASGTVTAQLSGPISVGANTINKIITGINGWSTVNNSGAGNLGTLGQSDTQLRQTRIAQLAIASSGSWLSILAGATALNPISAYVKFNNTTSNTIIAGITILANSVLLVIELGGGSLDLQLSTMFLQRLSGGCAMSGTYIPSPIPIPNSSQTFQANWQVASSKVLGLNITLKLGSVYPPNLTVLVASLINTNFSFNVIGQFIDANEFTYILISNGISPVLILTFNVGSNMNLNTYTMPISDSLGTSLLSSNVSISYV